MVDSDFSYETNSGQDTLESADQETARGIEHDSMEGVDTSSFDESQAHNESQALTDPASNEVSEEFVGQWNQLISTTNWEKGKIILQWREALIATEAPATCFSDEAWAQRVGGVTSQHVGRLRRVFERFGGSYSSYPKLYWSHFLAASDWEDAEMWLEGAVQSGWSISEMRESRWKALGGKPETRPKNEEFLGGVVDEDYVPISEVETEEREDKENLGSTGPLYEGPDFGDESTERGEAADREEDDDDIPFDTDDQVEREPIVNPFASLPALPVDVAESLELFKLAIVRHRSSGWTEINQDEMLSVVEALRQFVITRAG